MATLISGGAGFIGSHLCDRLINDGEQVIVIDNLVTGRLANIVHLLGHRRFTFINRDVVDELPDLPAIERIYHLASPASPPAYQKYQIATMRVNAEGTRRLLDLAASVGARFLYASTSEVYGDPLVHPQSEGYRGNVSTTGPRSMYDEAKRYGEALTQAYAEEHGVETRIIRIFNTYGPRLDPADGRVVSNFLVQALRQQPLSIFGDGSQTRSFQYVDDLIEGITRAMESRFRGPVNLGNPEEYSMLELARLVQDLMGRDNGLVFHPLPGDDPHKRRPDISLAWSQLGWKPLVPVREGLKKTIEYFRHELSHDPIAAGRASIGQSTVPHPLRVPA
ncbi:MAG: SDR family oxidoreductase [Chloroflexota bacterium]|nr:SDR family oxidoreductase [Chloroflexota bacterium]